MGNSFLASGNYSKKMILLFFAMFDCIISISNYSGCGGTIDASSLSSGQFAHPSYPADYSSSQTCSYVIKTGLGKRISLDFALFDLEGTSDCRYDSFEIRDGEAATAPLIGLYCGKLRLKNITSTGNALHMRFKSDSSTQFKGYLGTWKVLMDVSTTTKQAGIYSDDL